MRRILTTLIVLALTSSPALAQDFAKQRLEKSPRHQEWVEVKHDGRTVHSFIVYPEVKEKATAVLVIHEIFGLTDWVRSVADQLAEVMRDGDNPKGGQSEGPEWRLATLEGGTQEGLSLRGRSVLLLCVFALVSKLRLGRQVRETGTKPQGAAGHAPLRPVSRLVKYALRRDVG